MFSRLLIAAGTSLLITGAASAQNSADGHYFIEAGYAGFETEIDGDIGDYLVRDRYHFDAGTVRIGYQFSDTVAIEFDGTIGATNSPIQETLSALGTPVAFDGGVTINYTAGIFGRYDVPLGEGTGLTGFGRIGLLIGEAEVEGTGSAVVLGTPISLDTSYAEQKTGPVFGAGLRYNVSEEFYVRADATYLALDTFPTLTYAFVIGVTF